MKTNNEDGTYLFDSAVFGPLTSRRLGRSLGVNLSPTDTKLCNFNCAYCECGWSDSTGVSKNEFPAVDEVLKQMRETLEKESNIDHITLAGNGEPTLHPGFKLIIDGLIELRNELTPEAKIAVLTNGTKLDSKRVSAALAKVDNVQIKLDAGLESTFRRINSPNSRFSLDQLLKNLQNVEFDFQLQTMFVDGEYDNRPIGNASDLEIRKWLKVVYSIFPAAVHIYTLDRNAPLKGVKKVSNDKLQQIGAQVERLGIKSYTYTS